VAKSAQVHVTGIDHIYVTVADLRGAEKFYDRVMRFLGFRKGTDSIDGDPHVHYYNRDVRLTLRPARRAGPHDPYAPGLHHICLRVPDREAVDAAARGLRRLGIDVTRPRPYPQYAPDYYGIFFTDPDGIRLEIMNHIKIRRQIRRVWNELVDFENPLRKLHERKSRARQAHR
jgi:glyoxylase I family protein